MMKDTITVGVNAGEFDDLPMRDHKENFEKLFSKKLIVADMPIPDLLEYASGEAPPDITAYAPIWLQQLAMQDKLCDLEEFTQNSDITDSDTYDGINGDFFDSYFDYGGWCDPVSQLPKRGKDCKFIALPGEHTGATMLMYRKDIFLKESMLPETWDEFNLIVREISRPKEGFYGTTICGDLTGVMPVTDWYARFASQGGKHFCGSIGECSAVSRCYSEEGVKAYRWIQELMPYMSSNIMNYKATDCVDAMREGHVAMQINISSFVFPQRYYMSEKEELLGKIGAAEIPGSGEFKGVGYGGGWSLAIPRKVLDKELSWKALQFFTSKKFDKYRCIKYGVTPTRKSTVRAPEVIKAQPWVSAVERIISKATAPEYLYISQSMAAMEIVKRELTVGLFSGEKPEPVLKRIDEQMNSLLKTGGWQK